jgi:dTDP-4-amino-4,6-dideoxygalactose transaminase
MTGKFTFERIGFSAKMNELEAAVGLGNIDIFNDILSRRRRNMLYLIEKFRKFDKFFITLTEDAHEKLGPHAFSIIVREGAGFTKDEFVAWLEANGVDSRNLFYSMPTQCASYAFLGYKLGDFPEAEFCSDHGTHIGIHQDIGIEQLDHVVTVVEGFLKNKGASY